ncbi:2-dehydro-3-deoxyphosphogluconate aldolase/(4S)-4-hydroxy-2-oxoglutarate aldolase [Rhodobium orientis]|uniref:2-dehydro-3-deoxy-phosphogluconate aldolase n=1 Tax=Rhodobium orientis TaxID=34017 RepID=A0A327JVD2_9HYPH|nr:bifunctional 4-hydroxy-2-oxoglutarate aldolase/2-dehydro-3-deoxy-phosphogluconate aldolase [Rhodobium orientis]MBB4301014.1 2-dehydro-3-deoxyphosphogluconate aldolase/(4S)-4-hydroxy-2-oxoglutarate aldolase [Rhodobium orientis]MBK5949681.1 2-dehydro-3-deoxyphosphogluconate aldolase [Rhodobium orientis]RAI30197.1 2-dehydro-3-deoxyphosphogluconate aldolase [Rhodobium orientis]
MLEELLKRRIIPVIVIEDAGDAEPLAEALLKGGIDIIEVTFRTAAAEEAIGRIAKAFPDMMLGAGTVLTSEQADRALGAGARFGFAPGLNPKVVKHFQDAGGLFMPGVMTPSEIEQGLELGCKVLKFFPAAQAGGPAMIKALAGPYASQGLKFSPTGGITLDNMMDYLSLPVVSAIGGSWLATKKQIADKDWATIADQAKAAFSRAAAG